MFLHQLNRHLRLACKRERVAELSGRAAHAVTARAGPAAWIAVEIAVDIRPCGRANEGIAPFTTIEWVTVALAVDLAADDTELALVGIARERRGIAADSQLATLAIAAELFP